ncbi:cytochrome P450 [Mycena rebaudengoi]|nr:cytochrome P450 [Mycena rebaudengoi]
MSFLDFPSSPWAILGIFAIAYALNSRKRTKLPLPPGPPKLPFIGNLLDIPPGFEWETYMEWSKKYDSDIIHLNAVGTSMIVLSSAEAINDLLEKRSSTYSDRSPLLMVNELMGWDFALGLMRYGEKWRAHRRMFHNSFNQGAAQNFHPKELVVAHRVLQRLVQDPEHFMEHFRQYATFFSTTDTTADDEQTGWRTNHEHNIWNRYTSFQGSYISLAEKAMHGLSVAVVPGRFLVDFFPFLKYVPAWVPGATFKRLANEWKECNLNMINKPFEEVKRNMASGTAPWSFVSSSLQNSDEVLDPKTHEIIVKGTAGAMYSGGSDTTVASMGSFIFAMLSNPDAQKKAQEEIDSVVRPGHLPDFSDQESLPYVCALVKEILRWIPVTPFSIPHYIPVEDEYKGYRIPAGSVVVGNTWAIFRDEAAYPDAHLFKPERFLLNGKLNPEIRDPEAFAFGYGRRICPGRHMAIDSVWITIVSILATLDITRVEGDTSVIGPKDNYFPGMVLMPQSLKCSIKPRSRAAEALINSAL